jgi:chromosome segregation ATPase
MSDNLTKKMPGGSNGKLDELFQIVQAVRAELWDLRDTVNTRLYDTRPMWEKLDGDITQLKTDVGQLKTDVGQLKTDVGQLKTDVGQLKTGQEELRRDVREIRTHMRDMTRRMSIFNDTLVGIQADYRDIYDRVREIERQRN